MALRKKGKKMSLVPTLTDYMCGVDRMQAILQASLLKKVFSLNVTIANNRERNNIY